MPRRRPEPPDLGVIHDLSEEEMSQYPVLEYTEENLVALGIDPVQAHFMMQVAEGKIDSDSIDLSKRRKK